MARRKTLAGDALRYRTEEGRLGPGGLDDPEPVLQRLAPEGSVLEGLEVSRLLGMLRAASGMRRGFAALRSRYPALADLAASIPDLSNLTQIIEGKVAADGRLEDSASPDLAAARRRIVQMEASLNRRLQETLEREMLQHALRKHAGKITAAATDLGISRPTFYELMDKLGIQKPEKPE